MQPREEASAARPALATAGGVLLAVALLEMAQQIVGAFSPRRSIEVALIVAVGLAALTAERLQRGGAADRLAIGAGIGSLAALGVVGAIWLGSGFSPPGKVPLAEQVDGVRADLRRDGFTVRYRELRLRRGAESHLFVLSRRAGADGPATGRSDELRLYEAIGGDLLLGLRFRPDVMAAQADRPTPASFRVWAVRDIDGDGQQEVLGSYDTNQAGAEFQRVPVMISRQPEARRHFLTPLLPARSLGRAASEGLPSIDFGPAGRTGAPAGWVAELALDRGRLFLSGRATIATSVVLPKGDPHQLSLTLDPTPPRAPAISPRHVRFWALDLDGPRPRAVPLCPRGSAPATVRMSARALRTRAFLGRPLADAMSAAGLGLGEFIDGRCLEAANER